MLSFFLIPEKINSFFQSLHFKNFFLHKPDKKVTSRKFLDSVNIFPQTKINSQKIKILFVIVIFFAGFTRLYNLNNPPTHYFDEVYHAFIAQNMLHGRTAAWEWWNTNPAGFAYEWTHPPLAKEGMVLGMAVLGENAFGWRFLGAMLGVGSVILIFFIAKEIFKDELLALIASIVFALDGLALV